MATREEVARDRVQTRKPESAPMDSPRLHGGGGNQRLPQALSGEEAGGTDHDGLPDAPRGERPQNGSPRGQGVDQLRMLRRVRRPLPGPAPLRGEGTRLS